MEVLPTTVTHLAGPVIAVNGRVIQRCPCCGQKLLDSGLKKLTDRQIRNFPIFPTACLVHYDAEDKYHVVPYAEQMEFPPDFCIDLVEP